MAETLTKKDLVGCLAAAGFSKADAGKAVDTLVTALSDALAKGDTVDIARFGKFEVAERAARTGKNPKTGEKLEISAKKAPRFRPSKTLKDAVAGQ